MGNFLIAAAADGCGGLRPIVSVIHALFRIIQIFVPIALWIMSVIDLSKAVLASDDKEIKAATGKLTKRAIAAVAVFFAFTLVDAVMGLVGEGGDPEANTTDWVRCWNNT